MFGILNWFKTVLTSHGNSTAIFYGGFVSNSFKANQPTNGSGWLVDAPGI